ncbi:MAG: NTP transferase domain-containing protein [Opitutales bacterium]|nr:NTP transferase domain-containing protein [Opitutales bacterium]
MKTPPTLLILAAGMGSRYGGLKQIEPMGPEGETILEYSVFDAIRSGFGKVVFVIRRDFDQAFRDNVLSRFTSTIDIECVYQDPDDLPGDFRKPTDRSKPWGTGHAVLAARKAIHEPFAVINADDFYGAETFKVLARFCADWQTSEQDQKVRAGLAAFPLASTLSAHGAVSRGICSTDAEGRLLSIREQGHIRIAQEGAMIVEGPDKGKMFSPEQLVSMNAFAFESGFFKHLETAFEHFLSEQVEVAGSEFFLPEACTRLMREGNLRIDVARSDASWLGVTYGADAEAVRSALKMFTDQGLYPQGLWQGNPSAADEQD